METFIDRETRCQFDVPCRIVELGPTFVLVIYYTWSVFPRLFNMHGHTHLYSVEFYYLLSTASMFAIWAPFFLCRKLEFTQMVYTRCYVLTAAAIYVGVYAWAWLDLRDSTVACAQASPQAFLMCQGTFFAVWRHRGMIYTLFIVPMSYQIGVLCVDIFCGKPSPDSTTAQFETEPLNLRL